MNIEDPLMIEILSTLDRMDKANKAIIFHKSQPMPDANSIGNYERQKADFLEQLATLLHEYQVEVVVPKQAA